MTRITGTLRKELCTFFIISRRFLLGMRNFADRMFRGNQNTHFIFNGIFSSKNLAVGEIMWKSINNMY